jgi:hypothetical protein
MSRSKPLTRWCTYTEYAHEYLRPRHPYRIGRFIRRKSNASRMLGIGGNAPDTCLVHWVGLKTQSSYAVDFIRVFAETPEYTLPLPRIDFPGWQNSRVWSANR